MGGSSSDPNTQCGHHNSCLYRQLPDLFSFTGTCSLRHHHSGRSQFHACFQNPPGEELCRPGDRVSRSSSRLSLLTGHSIREARCFIPAVLRSLSQGTYDKQENVPLPLRFDGIDHMSCSHGIVAFSKNSQSSLFQVPTLHCSGSAVVE